MIPMQRMWADDDGQEIIEYGMIVLLIAITLISVMQAFGNPVFTAWQAFATRFVSAV